MTKKLFAMLFLAILTTSIFAQEMSNEAKKLFNAGEAARKAGDYPGAVAKFDEALKEGQHPDIYFRRGYALLKNRQLDEAIASLQSAINLNADFDQAYFMIGQIQYSQKKYDEAIATFEKTKEVSKKSKTKTKCDNNIKKCKEQIAFPFVLEGNGLLGNNDYNGAIAKFNAALNVYERADAYAGLANAYYELGKYDDAIASANNSLKLKKKNAAANFFLGLTYKAKGDNANAKTYLAKVQRDKSFGDRAKYELEDLK